VKRNISSLRISKTVTHRVEDFKFMMKNPMKGTPRKGPEMRRAAIKLGLNPKKS
jgi:hypothetical protein